MHTHTGNEKEFVKYIIKTNIKTHIKQSSNNYNILSPNMYI